jgi:hypothetical protein
MKKNLIWLFLGFIFLLTTSFSIHKFSTALFKIEHNAPKKRLEITARIFVDDLNVAIATKFKRKSNIGSNLETEEDLVFLKKYMAEKLLVIVNGKPISIEFLSKETENNVLICYFNGNNIPKIKTFEIKNSVLIDEFENQQNIVHLKINNKKQTLLLSAENPIGKLK